MNMANNTKPQQHNTKQGDAANRGRGQRRRGGRRQQNNRAPQSEYEQKILDIARVARVTAGGRRFNFRVTMVVGNRKGKVGIATGRGKDVAIAVAKATRNAEKNVFFIPMTPEGTLPYEAQGKKGSAKVMLRPARSGRGIIAGGPVRIICELAGYKDLSAKIIGRTTNKLNNGLATVEALKSVRYVSPVTTSQKRAQDNKKKESKDKDQKKSAQDVKNTANAQSAKKVKDTKQEHKT